MKDNLTPDGVPFCPLCGDVVEPDHYDGCSACVRHTLHRIPNDESGMMGYLVQDKEGDLWVWHQGQFNSVSLNEAQYRVERLVTEMMDGLPALRELRHIHDTLGGDK